MEDWQVAVLNSENLKMGFIGDRMVLRACEARDRTYIPEIVGALLNSTKKPYILESPDKIMVANKKAVTRMLMDKEEFAEHMAWMAEAEMNGVI